MSRLYTNNAATTLDGAITDSTTTIVVTDASVFPTPTGGDIFRLTMTDGGTNVEIVEVTSVATNTLTVVRAQESTLGFAFADDAVIQLRPTADSYERLAEADQSLNVADSPTFVDVTIGGFSAEKVAEHTYANLHTGLISGGNITVTGGDPAKFDIAAGTAVCIDYYTDPANPTHVHHTISADTAQSLDNLLTDQFTYIYVDTGGLIQQTSSPGDLNVFFKDKVLLGIALHTDNATITSINQATRLGFGLASLVTDGFSAIGPINVSGNIFTPNGANLTIDKSQGDLFREASNRILSNQNANVKTSASAVATSFVYLHRDGSGGFTIGAPTTTVDPDNYDDGSGSLVALGNNKWTVQRVYLNPFSDIKLVEYGQNIYSSLDDATAATVTETHVSSSISLFRCWMVIKKGQTSLNSVQNTFISAPNLPGAGGAASAALAAASLQSAYDSSSDAEIILGGGKSDPALSIVDNASPIGTNLLEVQDSARTTDFFAVTVDTATYAVDIDLSTNYMDIGEISTPANPAANVGRLYVKDDTSTTTLYFRDSAGTETDLLAGGGGGGVDIDSLTLYPTTDLSAFQDRIALFDFSAGITYKIGIDKFLAYAVESLAGFSAYATDDLLMLTDISGNITTKITGSELVFEATDITAASLFLDMDADFIPYVDTSAGDLRKMTPESLFKTTIELGTQETTVTPANDLLPMFDSSAAAYRSVKVEDIVGSGKLLSVQTFTANGTWTRPAGVTAVKVTVIGGGGGSGGSGTTAAGEAAAAGGGGGGGAAIEFITAPGATETITIGAGGLAGAVDANAGAGGTSSFGAFCSATGGAGSTKGNDSSTFFGGDGGVGGTGSGGDLNLDGGKGGVGQRLPTHDSSRGGDGGTNLFGEAVTTFGAGSGVQRAGTVGSNYGGGASGSCLGESTTEVVGSAGGPGFILVEEFS